MPVLARKAMIPVIVKRRRHPNKNIKNKNMDTPLSTVVVKDMIKAMITIEM